MSTEDLEYQSCQATKDNGEPCGVPGQFVDQETGLCQAHGEDGSERMAELGAKGGSKSSLESLKGRLSDTLEEGDLGPLESYEDAERWLAVISRAVLTGRLEERRAQAGIRGVVKFIETRESRLTAQELEDLRERVEEVASQLAEEESQPW